jgi:D-3-phosphoglycerate dehydrogenase
VIASIISLARGLGDGNRAMHAGRWLKSSVQKYEVRGKVLGIIGYGHVGSQLSVLAEALGMRVIYYDTERVMPLGNAQAVDTQADLLALSDFVSLHVPLTDETANMIGSDELAQMKQGASYLINFARGKCVDVEAVAAALHDRTLLGAAFDVYPTEPAAGEPFSSPLQNCPNALLSSHIGGSTVEAQTSIGIEVWSLGCLVALLLGCLFVLWTASSTF